MEFHLWYYAVMAIVPLSIATYNFTLGYLRDLSPKLIPFYMSTVSMVLYGGVCLVMGLEFIPTTTELDDHPIYMFWLLALVANGACYLAAMQTKIAGFKYDLVTRVAPVEYLETPYSLIVDAILFKVSFSTLALSGLGLVIVMFVILIYQSLTTSDEEFESRTKKLHRRSKSSTDSAHHPME